jgi:shikimate 5-dehydrogenase
MSNASLRAAFQSDRFAHVDRKYLQVATAGAYRSAMASSVSGKVAFITGGASGIGAALTSKLADEGAEIWIADRQIGEAEELAERLNSGGATAHTPSMTGTTSST